MMRSTNLKSVKWSLIYVLPSARKNFRKKVFKTSDKNKCILLTSVRNNVVTHICITQKELILRCPCSQFKMLRSYQCFLTSYRIYVKQLELYFRFGNHQIQRRLTLSWQSPYHIETSPLIWRGTQVTGFCMTGTSVMKELNKKRIQKHNMTRSQQITLNKTSYRSSRSQMFLKIVALKNFVNFWEKQLR